MLNFLRKKQNMKFILWIICIVVVITFVFWGAGSSIKKSKSQPKYAGIIFGKKMPMEKFIESYRACERQALMAYGQNFSKVKDYLNLTEQAWSRLILLKEANRRKIKVTDKEVVENIKKFLIFEEEGQFDKERYEFILRKLGTTPRSFEEHMRQSLKISKLMDEIVKDVTLTDKELEKKYKEEHEKLKVAYVLIEPKDFKGKVEVIDSEVKIYYQENKDTFKIPPKVNVEYLPMTSNLTKDKVEISEKELLNYYQNNKESFKKQKIREEENDQKEVEYKSFEEVKNDVKNILSNTKSKDIALDIAVEVNQKIKDGLTFAEVAKEYSLSIKETGLFSAAESIPEIGWSYNFLNTAFSLKTEEASDLVELPDGYYILKLKDKKDSYIPEHEEVKDQVKNAYINDRSHSLAQSKAKEYQVSIKEKIQSGQTFKEACESLSLEVQITEYFTRYEYVPGIGKSDEFIQSAFSLKDKEISNVISAPKGYCILTQENFIPINKEEFLKEKEEFKKKAFRIKEAETYQIWFENLRKEANIKSFI